MSKEYRVFWALPIFTDGSSETTVRLQRLYPPRQGRKKHGNGGISSRRCLKLKEAMITEPILQHFDPERAVTIETDASDYAIGAICSQPDKKGILHPVAYYSRKLKDLERNYNIHDKELLVIVDALRKWDTYCKTTGLKITILTDHKNLEYWKTKKDTNLRQAR